MKGDCAAWASLGRKCGFREKRSPFRDKSFPPRQKKLTPFRSHAKRDGSISVPSFFLSKTKQALCFGSGGMGGAKTKLVSVSEAAE